MHTTDRTVYHVYTPVRCTPPTARYTTYTLGHTPVRCTPPTARYTTYTLGHRRASHHQPHGIPRKRSATWCCAHNALPNNAPAPDGPLYSARTSPAPCIARARRPTAPQTTRPTAHAPDGPLYKAPDTPEPPAHPADPAHSHMHTASHSSPPIPTQEHTCGSTAVTNAWTRNEQLQARPARVRAGGGGGYAGGGGGGGGRGGRAVLLSPPSFSQPNAVRPSAASCRGDLKTRDVIKFRAGET